MASKGGIRDLAKRTGREVNTGKPAPWMKTPTSDIGTAGGIGLSGKKGVSQIGAGNIAGGKSPKGRKGRKR